MALEFEWDPGKAAYNQKEHGVSFDEATTVFQDTLSITIGLIPNTRNLRTVSWTLACRIVSNCLWYRTQNVKTESES